MSSLSETICHCGNENSYPDILACCLVCRCDEHAARMCGSACLFHGDLERTQRASQRRSLDMPRPDNDPYSYYRLEFLSRTRTR